MSADLFFILKWDLFLFIIGLSSIPITFRLFSDFFDSGYIFSKILGAGIISYLAFILGFFHILTFSSLNLFFITILVFLVNYSFFISKGKYPLRDLWDKRKIILAEEVMFLLCLLAWSFIRATQPDIHGLEKYMDFGFINSILRSEYFPPKDMWFSGLPINYYYFGHLLTAVLTKLSNISSYITFNLMVATIFALSFTESFSLGVNIIYKKSEKIKNYLGLKYILSGLLTAFLVNLAGNLHTLYTFFLPYIGASPMPFWNLVFSPYSFPNSYWYPNATRFIYNTIHEFPSYSYVVSDLHGHVLDIPFVLLTLALILSIYKKFSSGKLLQIFSMIILGFLLAIMYMTNTLDGAIYLALISLILLYFMYKGNKYKNIFINFLSVSLSFVLLILPFSINFKPFVSGIGLICAPDFLLQIGKLGPFLFEADRCMRSPLWQLFILYGFFYFFVGAFILFLIKKRNKKEDTDLFILFLILLSTLLIIAPEFFYIKDIYEGHYRANTMFKLVYQSFIVLSITSSYVIFKVTRTLGFLLFSLFLIVLVGIYPYFAINSYYAGMSTYKSLDGISYLRYLYPSDYDAILWINENIQGQPVILEAQGDSYSDFARVSANTGLPTILGWTVHEWLWRGTYDITAPRITDIQSIYTSQDLDLVRNLLNKYQVKYIFVGSLETQKYGTLVLNKFDNLGQIVFQEGNTKIYKVN